MSQNEKVAKNTIYIVVSFFYYDTSTYNMWGANLGGPERIRGGGGGGSVRMG